MTARRKPMTAEDRAWYQGIAVALGTLSRAGYNEPSTAADIALSLGLTLADFKQARCEPGDVRGFCKALRLLESRPKRIEDRTGRGGK